MKSKVVKFLIVLLIAILVAPPSYANGDDDNNGGPPEVMVYLMYAMMATGTVFMIYWMLTGGPRRMMSMEEIQKNHYSVSLKAEQLPIFKETKRPLQRDKVELVGLNYSF